jgi:hypothetical protein
MAQDPSSTERHEPLNRPGTRSQRSSSGSDAAAPAASSRGGAGSSVAPPRPPRSAAPARRPLLLLLLLLGAVAVSCAFVACNWAVISPGAVALDQQQQPQPQQKQPRRLVAATAALGAPSTPPPNVNAPGPPRAHAPARDVAHLVRQRALLVRDAHLLHTLALYEAASAPGARPPLDEARALLRRGLRRVDPWTHADRVAAASSAVRPSGNVSFASAQAAKAAALEALGAAYDPARILLPGPAGDDDDEEEEEEKEGVVGGGRRGPGALPPPPTPPDADAAASAAAEAAAADDVTVRYPAFARFLSHALATLSYGGHERIVPCGQRDASLPRPADFFPPPGAAPAADTRGARLLIAGNLFNSEAIMPNYQLQLLRFLVDDVAPGQAYVSIFESGSGDRTPQWLALLATLLETAGVPFNLTLSGAVVRRGGQDRISFLAEVRNALIAPTFSGRARLEARAECRRHQQQLRPPPPSSASPSASPSPYHPGGIVPAACVEPPAEVLFLNDVYFCADDLNRLVAHSGFASPPGGAEGEEAGTTTTPPLPPPTPHDLRPGSDIACALDMQIVLPGSVDDVVEKRRKGKKKRKKNKKAPSSSSSAASGDGASSGDSPLFFGKTPSGGGGGGGGGGNAQQAPKPPPSRRRRHLAEHWDDLSPWERASLALTPPPPPPPRSRRRRRRATLNSRPVTRVDDPALSAPALLALLAARPVRPSDAAVEAQRRWHAAAASGRKADGKEAALTEKQRARADDLARNFGIGGARFYDAWVSRDSSGARFSGAHPYVGGRFWRRLAQGRPVPVHACWNGLARFRAEPFARGLRFRRAVLGECNHGECSFVADDFARMGFGRALVDPTVVVSYAFVPKLLATPGAPLPGSSVDPATGLPARPRGEAISGVRWTSWAEIDGGGHQIPWLRKEREAEAARRRGDAAAAERATIVARGRVDCCPKNYREDFVPFKCWPYDVMAIDHTKEWFRQCGGLGLASASASAAAVEGGVGGGVGGGGGGGGGGGPLGRNATAKRTFQIGVLGTEPYAARLEGGKVERVVEEEPCPEW